MLVDIESIQRLTLGPDERLAVIPGSHMPQEIVNRIKRDIAAWIKCGENQVAIFPPGTKLEIISKDS